jgi:hypothetical protein
VIFALKQILSSQQYVTMCMRRNQIIIVFYGRGTFKKSKSISGMESHLTLGFLKANKNQYTDDHDGVKFEKKNSQHLLITYNQLTGTVVWS